MNKIKEITQYPRLIHFIPEQPVIKHINFVFLRRGDAALDFSPMARRMLEESALFSEVQLYNSAGRKNAYINVRLAGMNYLPEDTLKTLENYINATLKNGNAFHEDAMLAWANADETKIKEQKHADRMDQLAADFISGTVVPTLKEHTGHNADLTFVRFIPDGERKMKLGLTMGSDCKGCTVSFLSTVRTTHTMLSKYLEGMNFPADLTGVVILPNVQGSPSMSIPAPAFG